MVYVTVMQPPMYRQMTVEELLFGTERSAVINDNTANTRTQSYEVLPVRFSTLCNVNRLIRRLSEFNASTEHLRSQDRASLYRTFHIPKSSGHGFRRIDAPCDELMNALRTLKNIFESDFHALYHTSAFAYIKHRSTLDAMKRHQANESKWFGKFDLSNFFGNTTMEFVMNQFSMIFPFSEVVKEPRGRQELEKALELAFLNGGLPQGTPISPTITNIMMIPVDFKLANGLRNFSGKPFVYTRYADDFTISCKFDFNCADVQQFIVDTLKSFGAPFSLNAEKTRYGSSSGKNWNLGIMLNKDNELTVGHKKKRQFQAALSNYVLDKLNGMPWSLEDVRVLDGQRNYYRMIEGETIDRIVAHIGAKYKVDIGKLIKEDMRS